MPVWIAAAIRHIIIFGIQYGLWSAIERFVMPILEKAVIEVAGIFGVSEEDARDFLANDFVEAGEFILGNIIIWRTKIPVKVAEALRFTSKGFGKRPLSKAAEKATRSKGSTKTTSAKASTADIEKIAKLTEASRGINWGKIATFYFILQGLISTPTSFFYMLAQWVDFANWEGYFADFFRKIFTKLGLPVKADWRKPKTLSKEVFDKVYNTYKEEGALGINDPYKAQSVLFSRNNFLDLADKIGADLNLNTGQAAAKDVLGAATSLMIFDWKKVKMSAGALASNPASKTYTTPQAAVVPQIKVYTGVVAQGVLSDQNVFLAREDDLIENAAELELGAVANLIPFIKALPGRTAYQIKIATSVTDKQGFRREGQKQQIVVGYYKNGSPKYKTVTNKWAVMDLYVFSARGAKTKIDSVILGPVNSAIFNPNQTELAAMDTRLKDNVLAKSLAEVTVMRTEYPLTVIAIQPVSTQPAEVIIAVSKEATANTIQQPAMQPITDFTQQTTAPTPPQEEEEKWLEFIFKPSNYLYRVRKEMAAKEPFTVRFELLALIRQGLATIENGNYVMAAIGTPFTIDEGMVGPTAKPVIPAAAAPASVELGELVPNPDFLRFYTEAEIVRHSSGRIYLKPGVPVRWSVAPAVSTAAAATITPTPIEPPPTSPEPVQLDSSSSPDPCAETTINGFFGHSPSMEKRAKWYQQLGLGSSALYVGTAEQNAKLLAAIKRAFGCPL